MATTLSTLQTLIIKKADVATNVIGSNELLSFVNQSMGDLYDLMLLADQDRFIDSFNITLTANSDGYTLPISFLYLKGVDRQEGDIWVELERFNWNERNVIGGTLYSSFRYTEPVRYRLVGETLKIEPSENAAGVYRVWYVPTISELSSASDTIPSTMEPWKEYIIVSGAIKIMTKLERDAAALMIERAKLEERIKKAASVRDRGAPETMIDTSYMEYYPFRR